MSQKASGIAGVSIHLPRIVMTESSPGCMLRQRYSEQSRRNSNCTLAGDHSFKTSFEELRRILERIAADRCCCFFIDDSTVRARADRLCFRATHLEVWPIRLRSAYRCDGC